MGTKPIQNHLPRKQHYVQQEDFKRISEEAHLKEKPDDLYFQVYHTNQLIEAYGPKLPPIKYPYYFASIIDAGRFKVNVGLTDFEAMPYTIWFARPNQIYANETLTESSNSIYFTFSPSYLLHSYTNKTFLDRLSFYSLANVPYLHLNEENGRRLFGIFEKILNEYTDGRSNKDELIRVNVLEVLLLAERLFSEQQSAMPPAQSMTANLLFRFKALIENDFINHLTASDYADRLAVHPNYLNRIVKSLTGRTSTELIHERIKLEALSLLIHSNYGVAEVAFALGFEDVSHFSKFFKKRTGMSPVLYRKSAGV